MRKNNDAIFIRSAGNAVTAGTKVMQDGSVQIIIPMRPYTKKNSSRILYKKAIKNGEEKRVPFVAPSEQYKQYEKDCMPFLRRLNISEPVNVEAHFYLDREMAVDLTNLNEALHDILVKYGVLTDDNCRVIVSTDGSRAHYDKDYPRTEVFIRGQEETFPPRKTKAKKADQNSSSC